MVPRGCASHTKHARQLCIVPSTLLRRHAAAALRRASRTGLPLRVVVVTGALLLLLLAASVVQLSQ